MNGRMARQAAWLGAVAAVFVIAAGVPAAAANVPSLRLAFIRGGGLWVLDLRTHERQLVLTHAGAGPVHWSGDGRLISSGGAASA